MVSIFRSAAAASERWCRARRCRPFPCRYSSPWAAAASRPRSIPPRISPWWKFPRKRISYSPEGAGRRSRSGDGPDGNGGMMRGRWRWRRRLVLAGLGVLLGAAPLGAGASQIWKHRTRSEREQGDLKGVSLLSDGTLTLGPAFETLAK